MSATLSRSVGLLILFASLGALGRPNAAQQAASAPLSDLSPQLQISTASSVFHQGELIPLTLSFTSKNANRYQINMARYDRSGRMGYEKFLAEPTHGTNDPLLVFFKSSSWFMSGGLTNFKFLSDSPYVLSLDLNEWVRFDLPGHYRVTVTSRRVSDAPSDMTFIRGSFRI